MPAFALYAALRGPGRKLRAGETFPPEAAARRAQLERGKRGISHAAGGWTFTQMAEQGRRIAPADRLFAFARIRFRNAGVPGTPEEVCFPDTYAFTKGTRPEACGAPSRRARAC
jgi:hypothetical protein